MPAQTNVAYATRSDLDSGTIALIIGGVVTLVTTIVAALSQFLPGRKKAQMDANAAAIDAFSSLITTLQSSNLVHVAYIKELETEKQRRNRYIGKLERALIKAGSELPLENGL